MTRERSSAWLWLGAFAVCALAVVISVRWVDLPTARYVDAHLQGGALALWAGRSLKPLRLVPLLALLVLFSSGAWRLGGRRLPAWSAEPLAASWAVALATFAATVLKHVFHRASPVPELLAHAVSAWQPAGADSFDPAFPSGTMAVAAALAALAWPGSRERKAALTLLLAVLGAAVLAVNGHWVADLLGGIYLGAFVGRATAALRGGGAGAEPGDAAPQKRVRMPT